MSERLTKKDTNRVCYDTWELCGLDSVCKRDCKGCKIPEIIRKLAHYEDLEEQGKLIELPCKVGDTVFRIENTGDVDNEKWIIEPFKIMSLHHIVQLIENNKFGNGVFLTQKKAEAKLKEMEKINAE